MWSYLSYREYTWSQTLSNPGWHFHWKTWPLARKPLVKPLISGTSADTAVIDVMVDHVDKVGAPSKEHQRYSQELQYLISLIVFLLLVNKMATPSSWGGWQKLYLMANLGTFIVPKASFSQSSFIFSQFVQAWSYEMDISPINWHILLTEDSVMMYNLV